MDNVKFSEEVRKLIKESLVLAKVGVAYCVDEAKDSEEVQTLKYDLEQIVGNLTKIEEMGLL